MNQTVRYILKSIVHTHGTAFSRSQRLCKAYLADLMPDFPTERQQLVAAVADGLPHKLLLTQTAEQRKELALQFAQAHSIPAPQALATTETWFYALQELAHPKQASVWLSLSSYLGGVLTGFVILLVGSAIAFYKKLDEPYPLQSSAQEIILKLPRPLLSSMSQHPAKLATSPVTMLPQVLPATPLATKPTADSPFILSLHVSQWAKLDTLDTEHESIQSILLQTQTPPRSEPTTALANLNSAPKIAQAEPKPEPIAEEKLQPSLKPMPVATPPLAAKPSAQQEKLLKQTNSASSMSSDSTPATAKLKTTQVPQQTEVKPLLTKTTQAMQALVEQVLRLRKKQADQEAIRQLLNLTGDEFYRQQLTGLEQQIKQLHSKLNHLSDAYSMQVAKLCSSSPKGWQNGRLATGEQSSRKIQQWVLDDWKQCQGLSSQQIKQQLLTRYQILP